MFAKYAYICISISVHVYLHLHLHTSLYIYLPVPEGRLLIHLVLHNQHFNVMHPSICDGYSNYCVNCYAKQIQCKCIFMFHTTYISYIFHRTAFTYHVYFHATHIHISMFAFTMKQKRQQYKCACAYTFTSEWDHLM